MGEQSADDWFAEYELDGLFIRIMRARTVFEAQVAGLVLWHQMKDTKEGIPCAFCLLNPAPSCEFLSEDELLLTPEMQQRQLFLPLDYS